MKFNWKQDFTLILLFVSLPFSYLLSYLPCFSTNCIKISSISYYQYSLLLIYFLLLIFTIKIFKYLPNSISFSLLAYPIPSWLRNVSYLYLFNFFILLIVASVTFSTWFLSQPVAYTWNRKLCYSSGHLPELFLAFLLIPVSRNSFIASYFNVPVDASIQYHQLCSNLFGATAFLHFLSCSYGAITRTNYWIWLLPKSTWGSYKIFFGVLVLVLFIVIRLTSLPFIRRNYYKIFTIGHLLIPLPIIMLSTFHVSSVMYFVFPPLVLYLFDISIRIYRMVYKPYQIYITEELCGWIRVDVQGFKLSNDFKNGLYFDIKLDQSFKRWSHPFSLASTPTNDRLVFIIKPSSKDQSDTSMLLNHIQSQNLQFDIRESFDKDVEKFGDEWFKIDGTINGPFNCPVFENLHNLSSLLCIIGGSGITATTQLITEFIDAYPEKPVYLYWTFKESKVAQLSIVQGTVYSINYTRTHQTTTSQLIFHFP
ncbi:hypothetical protein BC833DRAFT_609853 [Globomyces pollinis-pini]|nr:hypothetical protein BC833DRAFT_609853 [Globomyces pollinis-pini]